MKKLILFCFLSFNTFNSAMQQIVLPPDNIQLQQLCQYPELTLLLQINTVDYRQQVRKVLCIINDLRSRSFPSKYKDGFYGASHYGDSSEEQLERLIKKAKSALILAAANNYLDLVSRFIDFGIDVNSRDKEGGTALIYSAKMGQLNIVNRLLELGADVNVRTTNGDTPLLIAINENQSSVAQALLQKNADVNVKNARGFTPLIYAANYGNIDIAQRLLEHQADVNARNEWGETPLSLAKIIGCRDMIELFRRYGAME